MKLPSEFANEIARLMRDPDARRGRHSHYDPNQPRVPAGNPKGGEWTDKGGGGRTQTARSSEEIDKEIARLMRDPDALRHADPSIVQPARFQLFRRPIQRPPIHPGIQRGTEAALALYAALSARNTPEQRAIFDFNAREFLRDPQAALDPRNAKVLAQREVENVCKKLEDVQARTDRVASAVRADTADLTPQQFGTAVHTRVAREINEPRRPDGSPKDPNYRAEVSYWKMREDKVYARKDSIRIDVLENAGRRLVCVYDIKTGTSRRSGLDLVIWNASSSHYMMARISVEESAGGECKC